MTSVVLGLVLGQLMLVPLARGRETDLSKLVPAGLAVGLVSGAMTGLVAWFRPLGLLLRIFLTAVLVAAVSATGFAFWLLRDVNRAVHERKNVVVSPADGTVECVKRIERQGSSFFTKEGERVRLPENVAEILSGGAGFLVRIAVTLLDAHATREPVEAEAVLSERAGGSFPSFVHTDIRGEERLVRIAGDGGSRIGVICVVSRLARRIGSCAEVCFRLCPGRRIGMTPFGGRVDLVVPDRPGLKMDVNVGDRVFAGVTVIARRNTAGLEQQGGGVQ